jgi:hypothetical protein
LIWCILHKDLAVPVTWIYNPLNVAAIQPPQKRFSLCPLWLKNRNIEPAEFLIDLCIVIFRVAGSRFKIAAASLRRPLAALRRPFIKLSHHQNLLNLHAKVHSGVYSRTTGIPPQLIPDPA